MKSLYALAGLVALGLPATALAQEIEGTTEIGLNIATSSGGNAKTTASIETELSFGGAFIAGGLETLYQDPTDSAEITLTLGYGFDISDNVAITASYSNIFLDKSGFSFHEVAVALDFPIGESISATFEVVHNLTGSSTDYSLAAEFGLGNSFTGEAVVGHDGTEIYGEAGISYEINETISTGFVVELTESASAVYNVGFTVEF
jgi:hypothetical protein